MTMKNRLNDDIAFWHWARARQARGGSSWSSYWATLISATVENAAPTHIILTFPVAQTSLGASDFTIAGFTVSSASWAGAVLTLVVTPAVLAYHRNLTITFVTTGETASVTNNVTMANTVGWYVAGDGSSTYVTKDGSDFVSVWKDLSGANHPLNQATGTNQPKWLLNDGIAFDGIDNFMSSIFAWNQPSTYYIVYKQTFVADKYILDGATLNGTQLSMRGTGTPPTIRAGSPSLCPNLINTAANNIYQILRLCFNGTSSKIQVNNNTATTWNSGANNPGGIYLGATQFIGTEGNITVKEIILKTTDDDAATETAIYNYLANKYGFATI